MSDLQNKDAKRWRISPAWIAAGIIILIVIGLASVAVWQAKQRPHITFAITPEIQLNLVAILTHKNSKLDTKFWQERFIEKLPSFLREQIAVYYKPPHMPSLATTVSKNELLFCFVVKHPKEWNVSDINVVQRTKINPAINSQDIKGARLHYGDGWYSQRTPFPGWSSSWEGTDSWRIIYQVRASDVPSTVREFELELLGSIDEPPRARRSFKLINPLYEEVARITQSEALPTTDTFSGIDVTLTAFASKAAEIGHSMDSRQFPWLEELQTTGRFFQAAGTPDDPNWCNVVVDITKDGKAAPWGVQSLHFYYGADEKQFTTSKRRFEDLSNAKRHREFFQFFPDVGMVQQAVKLEMMLKHKADFAADEVATIELDLPTTGGASRLVSIPGFWSGKCEVCVGNGGSYTIRRKYGIAVDAGIGTVSIAVRGRADDYEIIGATLQAEDGRQVDVIERVMESSKGGDLTSFEFQYDDNRIAWKNLPPVDLTDFSTLSLTVASPKLLGPFVFYAEPGVAEIPVGGK